MPATIIISILIAIIFGWNVKNIVQNIKHGKCASGCDGNCAHCSSSKTHTPNQ